MRDQAAAAAAAAQSNGAPLAGERAATDPKE